VLASALAVNLVVIRFNMNMNANGFYSYIYNASS